jgi:2-furoyl-CoA dehydrogenase large subunit
VATAARRPGSDSLPRLEDDVLLRGGGRFIDDLDPVPNAAHAAILRSPFAHARIAHVDVAAALEHPGVVGILTGADVAALSHPFPAGVDSPIPYHAAAVETVRYAGEPVAVVVARDRYVAEDALELIEVD